MRRHALVTPTVRDPGHDPSMSPGWPLPTWLRVGWVPLAALATIWIAWYVVARPGNDRLVVGAGSRTGDAYRFCEALRDVMAAHDASVRIEVRQTLGSEENVALLDAGEIDLATVQADIPVTRRARWVATLFGDLYLLIARDESGIEAVSDLAGRKVAVPPTGGGQRASFEFLLAHYGLSSTDVAEITVDQDEVIASLEDGSLDAAFRVRAIRNPEIVELATRAGVHLVPIEQGRALGLLEPSIESTEIPRGALSGNPPRPASDLPTVLVRRLLLARADLAPDAVHEVSRFLFEHRRELMQRSGIASTPDTDAEGTPPDLPIHPGTRRFMQRKEPSFIVAQADFLALIMSLLVLTGSGAVTLKQRIGAHQKNLADEFTHRVMRLYRQGRRARDHAQVRAVQAAMMDMLHEMVEHLDKDRISAEGYSFFAVTWQAVDSALRDLTRDLKLGLGHLSGQNESPAPPSTRSNPPPTG